jgi:hypothetical protein
MTIDRDALYNLLPAVYRTRDDGERGEPLRQFLEVLADEAAVIEENLAQLYDDQFVETAAGWVLPYIAELIGLRGLPGTDSYAMTPRAEVANTIGYRRRKGTAAVLEQLARDVTGWPARTVEYFELLVGTQYMNHVRPHNLSVVNIRNAARLAWVDSPFERLNGQDDLPHLLDVRRIASRRGRYNIPNVGIHLWRLEPYPLTKSPSVPAEAGEVRRFFMHPLSINTPLFTLPITEDEISHLAEPINVPLPISRRMFSEAIESYYGPGLSLRIDGVEAASVTVCNLSDIVDAGGNVTGWAHTPPPTGQVAIDPVLGRIAFGDDQPFPPLVSYHYGFSADIGGGEYERTRTFDDIVGQVEQVSQLDPFVPHATISDGLAALGANSGAVEIVDSGRYDGEGALAIVVNSRQVEIRSATKNRAALILAGDLPITGDDEGELTLNGLLIAGGALRVTGLRRLRLRHCTLVPGTTLTVAGEPVQPGATSLIVASPETAVELDDCITGGLRIHVDATLEATNSIVDAGEEGVAYASEDGAAGGGHLRLVNCTVLGKVHSRVIDLASNTIFLARVGTGDDPGRWPGPVLADRKQAGCMRFSYIPAGSRTPRRYHCQPEREADAARLRPVLTSSRYADPGYCQLDRRTQPEIYRGADDESEMGVFHKLFQPQREHYLQARLEEYLRFGLEVGIFFAS